ncbi:N-acetylmuramoyl-L-alanine amidase [Clostridium tyrobutyricum]|uniref:peptidoglycan recognition protein family protein n=1 Tax=Clostridium tyrobutyricum TaxID=1519 RepID=UPI002B20A483|nr:N-acetylmuramoyl-L-alanine amidase [Clostridium tyrobutyricum]MEA5009142.1 N-acetylmuramoyl-L-alanine amidase [Clostridium tyrobutyricum]
MNIINSNLKFRNGLTYGNNPKMVILHHADSVRCSIEDIHNWHLANGWSGCGYHYLVRKNGMIYTGRNEKAVGAHCIKYNTVSIGICCEGNFNTDGMGSAQYSALIDLIKSTLNRYGISKIHGHGELNSTDCPGNKFPLNRIRREVSEQKISLIYPGYLLKMNSSLFDGNVKVVQEKLLGIGYNVGKYGADGYFGKDTSEAVRRFQKDRGLLVDGIVGRDTWGKLFG